MFSVDEGDEVVLEFGEWRSASGSRDHLQVGSFRLQVPRHDPLTRWGSLSGQQCHIGRLVFRYHEMCGVQGVDDDGMESV